MISLHGIISELLEQQLRRINHDIETVYEEMFETQEKLAALQVMPSGVIILVNKWRENKLIILEHM